MYQLLPKWMSPKQEVSCNCFSFVLIMNDEQPLLELLFSSCLTRSLGNDAIYWICACFPEKLLVLFEFDMTKIATLLQPFTTHLWNLMVQL
jgi:hypothetical protein